MTGALPPSSRCTFLRSAAAAWATSMPARTLPVIETMRGVGWVTSARPVSRPPQTTLTTPGGRCSAISDRRLAAELQVHFLEVRGGRLGDLHASPHAARDRDHARGGVEVAQ